MSAIPVDIVLTVTPTLEVTLATPPPVAITAGLQGPAGPPGADGDGAITLLASGALGGHRLVAADGAGGVTYASCDDPTDLPAVLGMTLHAATDGAAIAIRRVGEVEESSWTWTPGLPVYLGLAGVPTQTLPPAALFGLIVGIPTTPTTLFLAPREPISFT
jgi:hypothetical protein